MRWWRGVLGRRGRGLRCHEVIELVTNYLEGGLPPKEAARVEAHLSGCDGCTAYVEQIRVTIRLAGAITEEQISPDARAALMNAFRSWRTA
jgi:anti-sigma factor RsiW